jgi:ABC-2 type transport system permease protein
MNTFTSFIIKEGKHILRDKRTMLILFGMPVVMMLLFGFAISTDVRNVRTVAVTSSADHLTQQLIDALAASEYFTITDKVATPAEAERLIRNQKADIAVAFAPGFANRRYDHTAAVQIIADGADPNMAQQYAAYVQSIFAQHLAASRGISTGSLVSTKLLYNPQMKSSYNFVPGIMGMLLMLICAMMTSISIVKEKERGTMEVLLVSPVRPILIIIAKAVPYMVLALAILGTILLLSYYVLSVPLSGSLFWILAVSFVYILLALALGLLISSVASTQLAALLFSAVVLLMPSVMLSGMLFPIESMPAILRYVTLVIPPRYYISAMRKLMIMGAGVQQVMYELSVLAGMAALLLGMAMATFKKRLE